MIKVILLNEFSKNGKILSLFFYHMKKLAKTFLNLFYLHVVVLATSLQFLYSHFFLPIFFFNDANWHDGLVIPKLGGVLWFSEVIWPLSWVFGQAFSLLFFWSSQNCIKSFSLSFFLHVLHKWGKVIESFLASLEKSTVIINFKKKKKSLLIVVWSISNIKYFLRTRLWSVRKAD